MRRWSFTKGHGTQNDFVLLLDREAMLDLGPAETAYLCDRRAGIGGDGVMRAVLARHIDEWSGDPSLWFMDYRNADGSVAEMCGNGIRVFARFLLDQDLASGPVVPVATRAGLREVTALPDGRYRVAMGPVVVGRDQVEVTTAEGRTYPATPAEVGNPHAVVLVEELDQVPLHRAPVWDPAERFPDGVNIEFVQLRGRQHVAMRVFERGSGETRSCGTGTVAAAAVARFRAGLVEPTPVTYRVDVPGGTVEVELTADQAFLTGPAVLVAYGEVTVPDRG
jgi:diaminopimelate epimerase